MAVLFAPVADMKHYANIASVRNLRYVTILFHYSS